jgi:biotin carboxylase
MLKATAGGGGKGNESCLKKKRSIEAWGASERLQPLE